MFEFSLEMLELWHQNEEYEKVVEALELLIPEDMTDNLYGQLARALNYLQRYDEALDALDHVSEEGRDDTWWYRRGYALFYLEQYEEARRALETVVSMNPMDIEAEEFANDCAEMMLRKKNETPFRVRVEKFWEEFEARESQLRKLMDEDKIEEAVDLADSLLKCAFHDAYFELGKNGEHYELILTAEGERHRLFLLNYWWEHAPEALLDIWDFHVGRIRAKNMKEWKIQMFGTEVSAQDVDLWVEVVDDKMDIAFYSDALVPLLDGEGEEALRMEDNAYGIAEILLDQALGEQVAINTIDGLELLTEPLEGESMKLEELFGFCKTHCADYDGDPRTAYMSYHCLPREQWRLREDIVAGSSCINRLINEYYTEKREIFTEALEDGAVFGFLFFDHGKIDPLKLVNLRSFVEEELEVRGDEVCSIIGGATGTYYSYIDVVCYDQIGFLTLATEILNSREELHEMGFSEFIMGGVETDLRVRISRSYSQEEKEMVGAHIKKHFGTVTHVLKDMDETGGGVDLLVITAEDGRKVFCTMGMGGHRMNVSFDKRGHGLDRAEVFMILDEDRDPETVNGSWEMKFLRDLARHPMKKDSWLGFGHTVSVDHPYEDYPELAGAVLSSATAFGWEAGECTLSDGAMVTFYEVLPITSEEMKYKDKYGSEALLDLLCED